MGADAVVLVHAGRRRARHLLLAHAATRAVFDRDAVVDAGGDVQCRGHNAQGQRWRIGIRNPFDEAQIVKVVVPGDAGVATSGTYVRGRHIYDPHMSEAVSDEVASLTVIGPDIYEADRFATAAFAMGRHGVVFLERQPGLEAYSIGRDGVATMTSGFTKYVAQ